MAIAIACNHTPHGAAAMPPPGKLSRLVPHDPQICPIGSLTVWLNPGEIPNDALRGAPGRAPRPPLERLDAEPDHAEVVGLACLQAGVVAKTGTNPCDIDLCPGQEQPTRLYLEALGILAKFFGCIVLGVDADRIHEDIPSDALSEGLLHLHQGRGREWAATFALRIHEIDQDRLVLDQVVVEPDLLVFMGL